MDLIEKIEEIQARLTANLPKSDRLYARELDWSSRGSILIGARGVGKSTILIRQAVENHLLYASCDNPTLMNISLWDLAETAYRKGYNGLALDEVHFAENWSQSLKAVYDSFPRLKVWASDSISLTLDRELGDLSRRFVCQKLPILSLREFIHLRDGIELPKVDVWDIRQQIVTEYLGRIRVLAAFNDYLDSGTRPFFLEGHYHDRLRASVEKTVQSDMAFVVPEITKNSLRATQAIIGHLSSSHIPTINIDTLSRKWSLSKQKVYQLLMALDQLNVITIVRKKSDRSVQGKGAKLLFYDPAIYSAYDGAVGNARESCVVTMFETLNHRVFAAKTDSDYDYLVDNLTIEIGGKSKKSKNADFVIRDGVEHPYANVIPLWTLACQY